MTNASPSSGVLPQGAPESPAIIVAVSDHVWENVDAGQRNRNIGWQMDNIHFTSIAHADGTCLFASSKKDLVVRDAFSGFLSAGLETGPDINFWTKTTICI